MSHEFRVRALLGIIGSLLVAVVCKLGEIGDQLDALTEILR